MMSGGIWPRKKDNLGDFFCPFMVSGNMNGGKCIGSQCSMWKSAETHDHRDLGHETRMMARVGVRTINPGYGSCSLFNGQVDEVESTFEPTHECVDGVWKTKDV